MKITAKKLKQIIMEEIKGLNEGPDDEYPPADQGAIQAAAKTAVNAFRDTGDTWDYSAAQVKVADAYADAMRESEEYKALLVLIAGEGNDTDSRSVRVAAGKAIANAHPGIDIKTDLIRSLVMKPGHDEYDRNLADRAATKTVVPG